LIPTEKKQDTRNLTDPAFALRSQGNRGSLPDRALSSKCRWSTRQGSGRIGERQRDHGPARLSFLVICSTIVFAASCTERRCQEAADPQAAYTASVVDIYDASSKFFIAVGGGSNPAGGSCQGVDGLVPGIALGFRANGEVSAPNDTCLIVTAELASAPAQIGIGMPSSDTNAGHLARGSNTFMYAVEDVTLGGCSGPMIFEFHSQGGPGGIFGVPVVGQLPPSLLYRLFLPIQATCSLCADNFVVQLSKT
jgi:hypothetical protein